MDFLYNNSDSEAIVDKALAINGIQESGNLIIPIKYSNVGLSMYHYINYSVGIKHTVSYLTRENSLFTSDGTYSYQDYRQKVIQFMPLNTV